jgi:hypothetical protein
MNRSIPQAYEGIAMDRKSKTHAGRTLSVLTVTSGVAAVLFLALAATSYRFDWAIGRDWNNGSMPTPSWGGVVANGYVYVKRTTEKLVFDVGDEGTFILSVPPDIERSFLRSFGSTFANEIWVTGNIYDPEARHEFHHRTVWVSLWLLGGVCAVLPIMRWSRAALLHRSERLRDRCTVCRYWVVGNQSGICPECGTPIPGAQKALLAHFTRV